MVGICLLVALGWTSASHQDPPRVAGKDTGTTVQTHSSAGRPTEIATFNKKAHSLSDPASIWVIVNKKRPLNPKDYAPSDLVTPNMPLRLAAGTTEMLLRREAATALENMAAAGKRDGINLMVASAYRPYGFQATLYNRYVNQQGQAMADTQSARPGYSEHQTGLAVDLEPASRTCEVEVCFATTAEGKWLDTHAHLYGFVIRYAKDQDATTGYTYEPWHLRYVGTDLSNQLHKTGTKTLEDFFSLEKAADY